MVIDRVACRWPEIGIFVRRGVVSKQGQNQVLVYGHFRHAQCQNMPVFIARRPVSGGGRIIVLILHQLQLILHSDDQVMGHFLLVSQQAADFAVGDKWIIPGAVVPAVIIACIEGKDAVCK